MVQLSKIIYYGRGYRNECGSDLHHWWFNIDEEEVQWADDILQGLSDGKQLQRYVKLFAVDIIELEKEFFISMNESQLIEKIQKDFCSYDFDTAFKQFLDSRYGVWDDLWWAFERNHLLGSAIKWCEDNQIEYEMDIDYKEIDKK